MIPVQDANEILEGFAVSVAEIELENEEEWFEKPDWVGLEVTGEERYNNSALTVNPYKGW